MKTWWGYVTSTSPLLVGRSSSSTPEESIPISGCLAPGLVVGDRVLVQLVGTAATVLGKNYSY